MSFDWNELNKPMPMWAGALIAFEVIAIGRMLERRLEDIVKLLQAIIRAK